MTDSSGPPLLLVLHEHEGQRCGAGYCQEDSQAGKDTKRSSLTTLVCAE